MEKLFFKMAGGRMHTPLAISCRDHQKSLANFSHLAPLILFFFTKKQSQKKGGHLTMPPLTTLLPLRSGL